MGQQSLFDSTEDTLTIAKQIFKENRPNGTTCLCCGRSAQEYRRTMNSGMARVLIWMVQGHAPGAWVDTRQGKCPSFVTRCREQSKLAWWGLAETKLRKEGDGRRAIGMWRPTELGREFVRLQVNVHKYAIEFDSKCERLEGPQITIIDALGHKFDYTELMNDTHYKEPKSHE